MPSVEVLSGSLQASSGEIASALALLDDAERHRAGSFHFARDRRRFVIRRARLRRILAERCRCDPRKLTFTANEFGKPAVAEAGLHFSASHSDELWVVAIASRPLGVDCERISPLPDWRDIAASLFGRCEVDALAAIETNRAPRAFFDCWARKEAFVKALGIGLSYPLDAFAVSVTGQAEILGGGDGWTIAPLSLGPLYAGAVVVEDDGTPLDVCMRKAEPPAERGAWAA